VTSVLLGSARTMPRLRAEFQALKESTRDLAARYKVSGAFLMDAGCPLTVA
jgi:hypothetical protein